jgi:hypothetical protein
MPTGSPPRGPRVVRWYQEDQVLDVVRSDPLGVNGVTEITVDVRGELADVFDGTQRVVAVFLQRPYLRHVYEPQGQAAATPHAPAPGSPQTEPTR